MPTFKTTKNILQKTDEDELYDENWMDSNKVIVPESEEWDYKREMFIEDVEIWQVIYEAGGGWGIYASWKPFCEFYMITLGWNPLLNGIDIETFYGPEAAKKVFFKAKEIGIDLLITKIWVENEDLSKYKII